MAVLFELFSFQKLIFLQMITQMISGDNKLSKNELSELDLKIISNVKRACVRVPRLFKARLR